MCACAAVSAVRNLGVGGGGSSHAKRGSSEGSMLGKRHFCDLHHQQKPYALHGHVIRKGTS